MPKCELNISAFHLNARLGTYTCYPQNPKAPSISWVKPHPASGSRSCQSTPSLKPLEIKCLTYFSFPEEWGH